MEVGKVKVENPMFLNLCQKIKACSASRNEHGLKHINVFSGR
jgi:hypothetical protein